MGPEKATGVDAVTSNFVNGVSVQVMRIGLPWTRQPMQNYTPADEPGPKPDEELKELPVRCPKCNSTEVVFGRLLTQPATAKDDSSPKFEWTCDSCGHEWKMTALRKRNDRRSAHRVFREGNLFYRELEFDTGYVFHPRPR